MNITRSQKNLDWVKSKFASLKANIHTQVNKSLLQQIFAATKFQQLFAAIKKTFNFPGNLDPHSKHTEPGRPLCLPSTCAKLKVLKLKTTPRRQLRSLCC